MPRVKDWKHSISVGDGSKDWIRWSIQINVSTKTGLFSAAIEDKPAGFQEFCVGKLKQDQHSYSRSGNVLAPIAPDMASLERLLERLCEEWVKSSTRTEVVILYRFNGAAKAFIGASGKAYSNGYYAKYFKDDDGAKGFESIGGTDGSYGAKQWFIGLNAHVCVKTIVTRGGVESVSYEHASTPDWADCSDPINALNSLVGLIPVYNAFSMYDGGFSEIPYSDDAARFFADAMLSLAGLALKIDRLFGDKEALAAAISNRTFPALSSGAQDKDQ